ncbi:MAG: dihydroorotase [Lachnospiraceae bacterium]|jgi:dihydroorotase
MKLLIRGGRVLDPASGTDGIRDVLTENGVIREVGENLSAEADTVIDASGKWIFPGLIDLHVHFRDPGFTEKETIRTGARAAARGGFTTVCMMPNTKPVIDSAEAVRQAIHNAEECTYIHVLPIAAVTAGQDGEFITDFAGLKAAGAVAVSEDGKSVMNARVARQAMRLAALTDIPVFAHCEDINLRAHGVMNAGAHAKSLGLYGILNAVEDIIAARDILLAADTGCRLHLCHCSTENTVRFVQEAKAANLPVSAEVTPHHFSLTEEAVDGTDSNYKMNPPLRAQKDVDALKKGLSEGVMDVISTDHAPHTEEEKKRPFAQAPFGIVGLETSVGLTMTKLVHTGVLTPMQMAEKMSYNPAQIIKSQRGTLLPGRAADITVVDPDAEWTVNPRLFASKGKNTPFAGWKLKGRTVLTVSDGRIVYEYREGSETLIDKDVRHYDL